MRVRATMVVLVSSVIASTFGCGDSGKYAESQRRVEEARAKHEVMLDAKGKANGVVGTFISSLNKDGFSAPSTQACITQSLKTRLGNDFVFPYRFDRSFLASSVEVSEDLKTFSINESMKVTHKFDGSQWQEFDYLDKDKNGEIIGERYLRLTIAGSRNEEDSAWIIDTFRWEERWD